MNDLAVKTFSNEIEIDENLMRDELEKFGEKNIENLLLSEIIFTINDKNELQAKYEEIQKSISEIGFEETARIYSLSDSKKSGGNLGWIYKNQLSEEIKEELNDIQIGDITKPIITSGGILILKLNDIKIEKVEIDKDAQLKKMIEFEKKGNLQDYLLCIIKEFIIMPKSMKNKPVVIICGDPESTFNEILIKSLKNKIFKKLNNPIIIFCSKRLFQNELKKLKTKINFQMCDDKSILIKKNIFI